MNDERSEYVCIMPDCCELAIDSWVLCPGHVKEAEQVRAAELADIEREIGRAYIHLRGHSEIVEWCESRRAYEDVNADKYRAAQAAEIQIEGELDELIARWRRLHAEGAE